MYSIYTIPGSCSSGITALCEQLGVAYRPIRREDVENYTAIVPTNQVPALQTESGELILEGAAIVLYLLEKHGQHLIPTEEDRRIRFYEHLMFNYATLHPAYSKIFSIATKVDMDDEQKQLVLTQLATMVSDLWKIVDKRLEGREYLTGDEATVVDYLLAIYTSWNNYFPQLTIALGENVEAHAARVAALPEFQRAYASEQIEFQAAA